MKSYSRREFIALGSLGAVGAAAAETAPNILISGKTGIRIEDVQIAFEEFLYRSPYKFGGVAVDRVTLLNVTVVVSTSAGKVVKGFGSMPLGNVWSYPSKEMAYDETLDAMYALAQRIGGITRDFKETAHPIEMNHQLEPEYLKAAAELSKATALPTPIPKLCVQVTASAFDAALHDAMGKSLGVGCYETYTRELMGHDLSRYLNDDFKEDSLDRYVQAKPRDWIWMFHSVGGLDAVLDSDLTERLDDGLPETLGEWIRRDNLQRIKSNYRGRTLSGTSPARWRSTAWHARPAPAWNGNTAVISTSDARMWSMSWSICAR